MKTLTADNVRAILKDSLFRDGEDTTNAVVVDGIMGKFGFHPGRITLHRDEIRELLSQLPENFMEKTGGGWSFLEACVTKDGEQWGEHTNVEQLLVLGLATKDVTYLLPRGLWVAFPGGMPYFVVKAKE